MNKEEACKVFGFRKKLFTEKELKSKYKKLAFKHHPDKGGNIKRMQDINIAFNILKQVVIKDVEKENIIKETPKEPVKRTPPSKINLYTESANKCLNIIINSINLDKLKKYVGDIFNEENVNCDIYFDNIDLLEDNCNINYSIELCCYSGKIEVEFIILMKNYNPDVPFKYRLNIQIYLHGVGYIVNEFIIYDSSDTISLENPIIKITQDIKYLKGVLEQIKSTSYI